VNTAFFKHLADDDKARALAEAVKTLNTARAAENLYVVDPEAFRQIPGTPFAYWVSECIRRLFTALPPFEGEWRMVKQGLATADDFRFIRAWWEVPATGVGMNKRWQLFAKGGAYSPFYADVYLVVKWAKDGAEMKANVNDQGQIRSNVWMLRDTARNFFSRPGITWPRRTQKFGPRILPEGCIFSDKGCSAFDRRNDRVRILGLLSIMASRPFVLLLETQLNAADATARSYEVGIIRTTPVPELNREIQDRLASRARRILALKHFLDTVEETSHAFLLTSLQLMPQVALVERASAWVRRVREVEAELVSIQKEIDALAFALYGFRSNDQQAIVWSRDVKSLETGVEEQEEPQAGEFSSGLSTQNLVAALVNWLVGVVFGRWDVRVALNPSLAPKLPDPFDPLPVCPPGMLVGPDGLPAEPGGIVSEESLRARPGANTLPPEGTVSKPTIPDSKYPLRISWDGILVDDPGFNGTQSHRDDIVRRVREVLDFLWGDRAQEIEQEACDILGVGDLRDYFRKPTGFFQDHLKRYSKSRRKAPIYQPLSTSSGSYTVWLYYHRLTDQTLYAAVNKYLEPKIAETERVLDRLEEELASASGRDATRLRDRLNEGRTFLGELRDLREELLRVAGLPYKPDLNDGVIINAAPLHKLFRLRSWAKETEKVWKKLEKGDYEWAHMAYTIWPDRVREVCKRDRSIAIAHGVEDICEVEPPAAKKKGGRGRRRRRRGAVR